MREIIITITEHVSSVIKLLHESYTHRLLVASLQQKKVMKAHSVSVVSILFFPSCVVFLYAVKFVFSINHSSWKLINLENSCLFPAPTNCNPFFWRIHKISFFTLHLFVLCKRCYPSKHKTFLRRLLDVHNVQKDVRKMYFTLSKRKMFLRHF